MIELAPWREVCGRLRFVGPSSFQLLTQSSLGQFMMDTRCCANVLLLLLLSFQLPLLLLLAALTATRGWRLAAMRPAPGWPVIQAARHGIGVTNLIARLVYVGATMADQLAPDRLIPFVWRHQCNVCAIVWRTNATKGAPSYQHRH